MGHATRCASPQAYLGGSGSFPSPASSDRPIPASSKIVRTSTGQQLLRFESRYQNINLDQLQASLARLSRAPGLLQAAQRVGWTLAFHPSSST